jgi:hypothetical protein
MPRELTKAMLDPKTPKSVDVQPSARRPETDPTLGIPLQGADGSDARHRLVTLGDSLTHGFQSGAIFHTEISFPAIIAWEMGWDASFRYPRYQGPGGLPLNVELIIRRLERTFGDQINWWELAHAVFEVRSCMDEIEDYWERGPGASVPAVTALNHNLGIYGWDVRDVLSRTSRFCANAITQPKDDWIMQVVDNANDRAALRVLPRLMGSKDKGASTLQTARQLGADGGIETLIVLIGANNALRTIVDLSVVWSKAPDFSDLKRKARFTVWDPNHFIKELKELADGVAKVDAAHVIWGTVPHITIAPIARGVANKVAPGSRYFPYYTRPWISDRDFDAADDPRITEQEARAIDSAIDQYNDAIVDVVRRARRAGRDWLLLDLAGVLDRLATRRYIEDPSARPDWWTPYEFPPVLDCLSPKPDSCFLRTGPDGRTKGGLFSLDGVHPTTVGYGIIAQEFIDVMQSAGVAFYYGDGTTRRPDRVEVDFARLLALDTLMSDPPRSLTDDLKLIGWIDQRVDFFKRLFRFTN